MLRLRHPLVELSRSAATAIYTHLARTWLAEVNSPLDRLEDKTHTLKA